ncbi:MAG: LamG-like jellyroll fold domain-containing protein [bacterium]
MRYIVFIFILLSISAFSQVMFADDFMRSSADDGLWRVKGGNWALQSAWDNDPAGNANKFKRAIRATNPFSWVGTGNPGWCATGNADWTDYTLTVSARIEDSGYIGLLCAMPNDNSGHLVRWSTVDAGNKMEQGKFDNGKFTQSVSSNGGLVPGRWYKITLKISKKYIAISVDGEMVEMLAGDYTGGIGLYCTAAAQFDDVSAIGVGIDTDEIKDREMLNIAARFHPRDGDMDAVSVDWLAPDNAGVRKFRHITSGDGHFYTILKPGRIDDGCVKYYLQYPAKQADVIVEKSSVKVWSGKKYHLLKIAKMNADEEYVVKVNWHGSKLRVSIDGEKIAMIDSNFSFWHQPAILYSGTFKALDKAIYVSENASDEYFDKSPTNWLTVGNWEQTTRWACSPEWSFLGGWGRGTIALWNKSAYTGDQIFEAVAGIKMEYPGEMQSYDDRYRGLAVTIMGNPMNENVGYTGIIGADDADGTPNRRTVLMRQGKIVATCDYMMPSRGAGHREWFNLRLQKIGNIVTFWLDNTLLIIYKDAAPITSGVPGLWVKNNGIVVARARVDYVQKAPAKQPQMAIIAPALPEWVNTGKYEINLKRYSPVKAELAMTAEVPIGENPPKITGDIVQFNFIKNGYHWYKICLTNGNNSSFPVDINLPVFNPSMNPMRDPLASYRFNEGSGETVKDIGRAPALNLKKPKDVPCDWKSGKGLQLHGDLPVMMSQGSANKLKSIAEKKSATISAWVSIDTVYPPPFPIWNSSIISWETAQKRNFVLGFEVDRPIFSTSPGDISTTLPDAIITEMGIHPSLHQMVITWDGTVTSYYLDGELFNQRKITWHTADWDTDAPLILGASANGKSPFLGRYYQVDIYDKCAGKDDVTAMYNAGPDG